MYKKKGYIRKIYAVFRLDDSGEWQETTICKGLVEVEELTGVSQANISRAAKAPDGPYSHLISKQYRVLLLGRMRSIQPYSAEYWQDKAVEGWMEYGENWQLYVLLAKAKDLVSKNNKCFPKEITKKIVKVLGFMN